MFMKILCPQCQETKQLSITKIVKQDKNIDQPEIFWDEAGNKHIHSPNWNKEYYRCSNGHSWSSIYWPPSCIECGWSFRDSDP